MFRLTKITQEITMLFLQSFLIPIFWIFRSNKHAGSVNSLDLNPFQANLLASGASDSEVSIWDLNKFSTPMTPGAKAQPLEDVRCVAWNKQVQHILATTGKYFFLIYF